MKKFLEYVNESTDLEKSVISYIDKEYKKVKIEKRRNGIYWIYRQDEDPSDFRVDVAELVFRSGKVGLKDAKDKFAAYTYYASASEYNERIFAGASAKMLPLLDSNIRTFRY